MPIVASDESGSEAYWRYLLRCHPQVTEDGRLNFYLRKNEVGHLALSLQGMPEIDLFELARDYGPVQLNILPILRKVVRERQAMCQRVAEEVGYGGKILGNAYASKAKDSCPVVREILALGDHYEISSPTGVAAAYDMWKEGTLPTGRLVICNGFFTGEYALVIRALRRAGFDTVIPVLDKPNLLEHFTSDPDKEEEYQIGLRQKIRHGVRNLSEADQLKSRFGMRFDEISRVAQEVDAAVNTKLVMYHIHLGSQITDEEEYLAGLRAGAEGYCRLCQLHPTLHIFDIGGGVPVPYSLAGLPFDLERAWRRFLLMLQKMCSEYKVPEPDILTEWGRHTVADHEMHLLEIIDAYNRTYQSGATIMGTFPDHWGIGQRFLVLPVNGFHRPWDSYSIAGLTCDEDDVYLEETREGLSAKGGWIPLPAMNPREQEFFVIFGRTGAYQENIGMLEHCMQLESSEITLDFIDGWWQFKMTKPRMTRTDMLRHMEFEV